MSTIAENLINDNILSKRIAAFFKEHKLGQLLKDANAYKGRGIPVVNVMMYLIKLVFTKKSMYMNILNGTNQTGFGKDVVYRLLNATFINWTGFLLSLAASVIAAIDQLTEADRRSALVVDDTMYERARSKKVELLARVHDHAEKGKQKFKRGFQLLTLGWSDGVTFIPLLFRHMSSKDQKQRYAEAKSDINKRSAGYRARQEAMSKKTDVLFAMLKLAKKAGITTKHVLFDSWFSYPSTMMTIKKIGFFVVGRLKDTKTIMYQVGGEKKTLKQIYNTSKKRRGRSRYLLSVEVLLYNSDGKTLPARIVFVRDRNNRKKWIAFCTTDMSLTEEEVIQLYGKRWDIEVFFKVCKSYLNLAKEFQGMSYDSMTAHTAVVMTRYIMLAVDKRQNEDPRSMGELFFLCYDEIADHSFADVMAIVLRCFHEVIIDCLFLDDSEMRLLIDSFVNKLSTCFKEISVTNPQFLAIS
jgi:hypothetical protein